jgi:hypothetical protein
VGRWAVSRQPPEAEMGVIVVWTLALVVLMLIAAGVVVELAPH